MNSVGSEMQWSAHAQPARHDKQMAAAATFSEIRRRAPMHASECDAREHGS